MPYYYNTLHLYYYTTVPYYRTILLHYATEPGKKKNTKMHQKIRVDFAEGPCRSRAGAQVGKAHTGFPAERFAILCNPGVLHVALQGGGGGMLHHWGGYGLPGTAFTLR